MPPQRAALRFGGGKHVSRERVPTDLPLVQAPARFCPRKLKPGGVKRYMSSGPLFGYMMACPTCGFIEMHQHEVAGFVEADLVLVEVTKPIACMLCHMAIQVRAGRISTHAKAPA